MPEAARPGEGTSNRPIRLIRAARDFHDAADMDQPAITRRDLFRLTFGGGAGLALGGLLDVDAMRAATKDLKLSDVSEFTTSCNFCSCGCGMIAAVRDGKLLKMEGDYDHIVNRGSLCVKGISMFATHASPQRLTTPRYRAPGSDHWEDISWDDAITRVAQKVRKTRDETWIATEKVDAPDLIVDRTAGDRLQRSPRLVPHEGPLTDVPVNRTDAIGFMGGAQNTNEECYLFQKAARLLGLSYVEHQARL
jgi:formate dehydrogenase major subunit